MPFGLTNAPYTFQICIGKILQNLPNTYAYLNDILIASPDMNTHVKHVTNVLRTLYDNGFSKNYEKCQFGVKQVLFLGNIITEHGIKPDVSKFDNLKVKTPKTKKQLEKILGFINWFRPYIPNISDKLSKFHDKLKIKNKSLHWDNNDQSELNKICEKIKRQPLLHYPDLNKPYKLKSEASEIGIGSML
ncbi:Retrovirus-related Pol polyprotein from transposon 17.6 [Dictyocoela muelleri]|nr:Retrovirus-related Pol polyprotein from transposon 17.6 [Dictyocoela muelleri]